MWYSSLDLQYQDDYGNLLICGDNTEILPQMPDESVDLLLTDPPYSLNFMGLTWDRALPPVGVWRECFRVLKPGGWAFVMCIPRMDCQAQMVMNLKEAGFNVAFSPIYHTFAQGFDKAMNMSKKVDERLGMEREVVGKRQGTYADIRRDENTGQDSLHGGKKAKERPRIEVFETAPASPEAIALDGAYSGLQLKPAVEVVLCVQKPFTTKHKRSDVNRILGGKYDYWYTERTEVTGPKGETEGNIEQLSKKYAKELQAADYTLKDGDVIERRRALRPDLMDELLVNREVILWSAPFKDSDITSSITHALDSCKGVSWLDDCRFPCDGESLGGGSQTRDTMKGKEGWDRPWRHNERAVEAKCQRFNESVAKGEQLGRFPANILVSDDVLNDGVVRTCGKSNKRTQGSAWEETGMGGTKTDSTYIGDSGSFSRYFSLDAWSQKHLPESVLRTFPFLLVPKASPSEKNAGLDSLPDKQMYKCDSSGNSLEIFGTTDGGRLPRKNNHPTVKSVRLMAYLITMGSREGDVVLDPYCGTSTTGVSCLLKDRRYVGVEVGKNWCEIGALRLQWAWKEAEAANAQLKLF